MSSIDQRVRYAETAGDNNPYGIMSLYKPMRFTSGLGIPLSSFGEDYWQYVDTNSGILYQKLNGNWTPTLDYSSFSPGGTTNYLAQSTGLISGGLLSSGSNNLNTFKIAAGTASLVQGGVVSIITWFDLDNNIPQLIGSLTYVSVSNTGTVLQSAVKPTNTQQRTQIFIGVVVHVDGININGFDQEQQAIAAPSSQFGDFLNAVGQFKVNGLVITPVPTTLNANISFGKSFIRGGNMTTNSSDPNCVTYLARNNIQFQYVLSNSTAYTTLTNTVFIPNFYENPLGTVSAVSAGDFTIQYIYHFPNGDIKIQLGQTIYNTIDDAIASIGKETYTYETTMRANGITIAYLIIQQGATNLDTNSRIYGAGGLGQDVSGGAAMAFDQMLNTTDSPTFNNLTISTMANIPIVNGALPNGNLTLSGAGTGVVSVLSDMNFNSNDITNVGLVDGVDISARDLILTSTTTTANGALQTTGGIMTGSIFMGSSEISIVGTADDPSLLTVVDHVTGAYLNMTKFSFSGTDYLGICASGSGILIYNVSVPSTPIYYAGATGTPTYIIADLNPTGTVNALTVAPSGNYLYAWSSGVNAGIRAYDITLINTGVITMVGSPNPVLVGSYTGASGGGSSLFHYGTRGITGIDRIDVSTELTPTLAATEDNGGGYTYALTNSTGLVVYVNYNLAFDILNGTSNITFTTPYSITAIAGSQPHEMALDEANNILYLARGTSGLFKYNVANPAAPVLLTSTGDRCDGIGLSLDGSIIYSSNAGTNLLHVKSTSTLATIRTVALTGTEYIEMAAPPYIYVACGTSGLAVLTTDGGIGIDKLVSTRVTTDNVILGSGTVISPSLAFQTDPDTGLYLPSVGSLGFVADGVSKGYISVTKTFIDNELSCSGQILGQDGTVLAPTFSFINDNTTGIFQPVTDEIAFTCGLTERMRLDLNGNLGIANNNPTQKLDVTGNALVSGTITSSSQFLAPSTAGMRYTFTGNDTTGLTWNSSNNISLTTQGSNRLTISNTQVLASVNLASAATVSGNALSSTTTITAGGSITGNSLISTTSITGTSCAITGSTTAATLTTLGLLRVGAGSAATPSLSFGTATGTGIYLSAVDAIRVCGAGTQLIQISPGQVVPIFNSVISLGITGLRWSDVFSTRVTGSTAYVNDSDSRLKTDILPLSIGLDFINALDPVSFKYIDTTINGDKRVCGFIAQEVLTVIEANGLDMDTCDIIQQRTPESYYAMSMSSIIPSLVKSIQELTARVVALEAPVKLTTIVEDTASSGESMTTHVGNYSEDRMKKEIRSLRTIVAGLRAEMDSLTKAEMMRSQREEGDFEHI